MIFFCCYAAIVCALISICLLIVLYCLLDKRISSIHKGNVDILHTLGLLPSTQHDLNTVEKFVVDAYLLKGFDGYQGGVVLFIMMHGEFFEGESL